MNGNQGPRTDNRNGLKQIGGRWSTKQRDRVALRRGWITRWILGHPEQSDREIAASLGISQASALYHRTAVLGIRRRKWGGAHNRNGSGPRKSNRSKTEGVRIPHNDPDMMFTNEEDARISAFAWDNGPESRGDLMRGAREGDPAAIERLRERFKCTYVPVIQ